MAEMGDADLGCWKEGFSSLGEEAILDYSSGYKSYTCLLTQIQTGQKPIKWKVSPRCILSGRHTVGLQ